MRKLDIRITVPRNYGGERKGIDRYMLIDSGELKTVARDNATALRSKGTWGSWSGGSYADFERKVVVGDNELVKESEKFLREIEDLAPVSRGWRNVDDVVGAVPNIPAFLAGHPQCMRRRERVMKQTSPLVIYMDLTTSASISAEDVQRRGVVLLALVRQLVEHRPVELWVGTSLGTYSDSVLSCTTAWRIDTAPLDLARAAFHISATSMARGFGYGICQSVLGSGGNWPLNDHELHCRTAKARLGAAFPGQEILYVPPVYGTDEMVRKPVEWIRRTMAQYVQRVAA